MHQPVRSWLRKVEREYTHWEWAACKELEDSVIVTNYQWWASVHAKYQTIQVHTRGSVAGVQASNPQCA